MGNGKLTSTPTIRRLPSYLHVIRQAESDGLTFISGTVIANELEIEPIQVRKDLALTGIIGKPRVGYPVSDLISAIERFLSWDQSHNAILVGAGNLGTALIGYQEFKRHGLTICAAFDTDPQKTGKKIHGIQIHGMSELQSKIDEFGARIAILTVPSPTAQETAAELGRAGIRAIWNFTNVKLKLPAEIVVQKEDLSSGYAVLCVKIRISEIFQDKPSV